MRQKIVAIRGSQVILDADVAELYGVETMRVNEAVKNNPDKFSEGYIITLTKEEKEKVIENFNNPKLKYSPVMPKAFTENYPKGYKSNIHYEGSHKRQFCCHNLQSVPLLLLHGYDPQSA